MYGLLHLFYFTRSIISADNNACADGDSVEKPTIRKIRLPEELTAARASLPRKFPTMRESAVLYSCWNRLPRKRGMANAMIFYQIDPSVISVVCCAVLFIDAPVCVYYMHIRPCLYA